MMTKKMTFSMENTNPQATPPAVVDEVRPIRLLKSTTLRGRNVYYDSTVIRQRVDLGKLAVLYSGEAGPGFAGRFVDRFLGLETNTPKGHMTEAFLDLLNSATGVRFEEALFEAILAVDASAAFAMNKLDTPEFAQIVRDDSQRIVDLVWECDVPSISRVAARVGLAGFVELLPETLYPHRTKSAETFTMGLAALRKRATRRRWSNSTAALALAAKERDLPCEPLGAYLRLGHGIAQQVIYASNMEKTLFSASQVARNKRMTNRPLNATGLAVRIQNKAATVQRASAAMGLDVAGGDLVTPDIARLHEDIGGRIEEMNSRPEIHMLTLPPAGEPSNAAAVLDLAFPPGTSARIPIAVIAGEQGTTSVARDLDTILRACGKAVGLAARKGLSICGEPVESGSRRTGDAVRFLLHDPLIEMLISTTSPRRVVQRGLQLDACDVAAIMNPAVNSDIRSFQRGVEVVVRATTGMLVVSAGNTFAINAIDRLDLRRVILLSRRMQDPSIRQHLAAGGAAVVRAEHEGDEYIELHRAGGTIVSVPTSSIKRRRGTISERRIQARMFAVALAFALGLSGQEFKSVATLRTRL